MNRLEWVLPIFVFVVMLGSNIINADHLTISLFLIAVIVAAIPSVIVFGLIKFLEWWVFH
ncbi:hypothetical protein FE407_02185 [Leuconostoc carnosum]|uniref:Uncharacterized protein n=2 Tax=Leuconostoc carnosum TaxID=1252 RepID=K0DCV5_LEUCJ|nr:MULTISPECIES: BC10 family protein [Leuconostoc]AFT81357.1 hypothetical protein C270_02210 [Leuconostoc carnosum JB16]KAA8325964.1 hypothetical protein FE404_02200 [Leuconostoc carnosum]KAA8330173.1 hypothetical protein FE409_02235 [Leuconostoc carnosum]KAA8362248.1 hypothetical protein FE407_02185 [Leuconostoc carnosum]KAA8366797.1 hypothetical protein FE406_02185 [Leuconostoc carnosum]